MSARVATIVILLVVLLIVLASCSSNCNRYSGPGFEVAFGCYDETEPSSAKRAVNNQPDAENYSGPTK